MQMPGETRQNIYMIFKESINNILKYAEATMCTVNAAVVDGRYILTIADNGKGMDNNIRGTGNGLTNIRKRANEINGEIRIRSTEGAGTILSLHLPYPFVDTKFVV